MRKRVMLFARRLGLCSLLLAVLLSMTVIGFPSLQIPSSLAKETAPTLVESIELSQDTLELNVGRAGTLRASLQPKQASNRKVTWETSDETVATISKHGQVKAVGPGECTITCMSTDGSEITAECKVTVVQPITKIVPVEKTYTQILGKSIDLKYTIQPDNASNTELSWASSNEDVATVVNGKVNTKQAGTTTITGTAMDGSRRKVSFKVEVSAFAPHDEVYVLTSKEPYKIPVTFMGDGTIAAQSRSSAFECYWETNSWVGDTIHLYVDPIKAGIGTIKVYEEANPRSFVNIEVKVEDSAVYSTKSYPKMPYTDVARNPEQYLLEPMSITGKVLQVQNAGQLTVLRVATRGSYRDVVYVEIPDNSKLPGNVLEDDKVTIFGMCAGDHTYTTIMGASVTLPALLAEKVIIK